MENIKECPFFKTCNHIDCNNFCLKYYKTNYYFENGLIPKDKREKIPLRIDGDGKDEKSFSQLSSIELDISSFVEKGNNLYIYSQNCGTGKTLWSFRLLRAYIEAVWGYKEMTPIVLFISVPRFLLELKSNITKKSDYIENILNSVNSADLVVWDDIGNKVGTEFETTNLFSIIDDRLLNNKSNIYTSNLGEEELHNLLGDRLYSRIFNSSIVIKFVGKDKRGINK